ncbi:hypothetical protein KBB68_03325 [Candidatus Babeliales bacterium]|nr:hypothetical protein [Candidatus Babeliales bacterium]
MTWLKCLCCFCSVFSKEPSKTVADEKPLVVEECRQKNKELFSENVRKVPSVDLTTFENIQAWLDKVCLLDKQKEPETKDALDCDRLESLKK